MTETSTAIAKVDFNFQLDTDVIGVSLADTVGVLRRGDTILMLDELDDSQVYGVVETDEAAGFVGVRADWSTQSAIDDDPVSKQLTEIKLSSHQPVSG